MFDYLFSPKKWTFRRVLYELGNIATLVAGVLASSGSITPEQAAAVIGIGKGLGSLAGGQAKSEK